MTTPANCTIRDDIRRGAIAACSIAYRREPIRAHFRGTTRVIDEAVLTEISLLRDKRLTLTSVALKNCTSSAGVRRDEVG